MFLVKWNDIKLWSKQQMKSTFLCGVTCCVMARRKLWAPFSCVFSQSEASLWTHSSLEHRGAPDLLWGGEGQKKIICNPWLLFPSEFNKLPWWLRRIHAPAGVGAWCVSTDEDVCWSGWSRTWRTDSSGPSGGRRRTAGPRSLGLNLSPNTQTLKEMVQSSRLAVPQSSRLKATVWAELSDLEPWTATVRQSPGWKRKIWQCVQYRNIKQMEVWGAEWRWKKFC